MKALSYGAYKELLLTNRQYAFAREWNGENVLVTVNNDDNDFIMTISAEGGERFVGGLAGTSVTAQNGQLTVTIKANSGEIWIPAEEGENPDFMKAPACDAESETEGTPACETESETADTPAYDAESETADTPACETESETADTPACGAEFEMKDTLTAKTESGIRQPGEQVSEESIEKKTERLLKEAAGKSYEEMTVEELQAAILAKLASNGPVTDQMKRDVAENIWHDSLVNWVKSFR